MAVQTSHEAAVSVRLNRAGRRRPGLVLIWAVGSLAWAARGATFTTNTTIAAGDATYDGQDIVVNGCTLSIDGAHAFASLAVTNAGTVKHSAAVAGCDLTVIGDVTVAAGAAVNVSAAGFGGSSGPGKGGDSTQGWSDQGAGGAGHAGAGGGGTQGAGGAMYGVLTEPVTLGSGGGRQVSTGSNGGAGGGAVKLTVGGTLTVEGAIRANGSNGIVNGSNGSSGGGSGGSLWLTASTFTGAGAITASGGNGGNTKAGGGAGGRIAIYACSMLLPTANITAAGGTGYRSGGAGTIHIACLCASPPAVRAEQAVLCTGESTQLSGTPGAGADTIEWFTDSCGGTPVEGGASPIVSPEATTTYYARTVNSAASCTSTACSEVTITVRAQSRADLDHDCDVDAEDLAIFARCAQGPGVAADSAPGCETCDFDGDTDVDTADFGRLQRCYGDRENAPEAGCAE